MDINNKTGKKYIRCVKRRLNCSGKTKKKLIESLSTEIAGFEAVNPAAGYGDYVEAFGSPADTAREYMNELSDKDKPVSRLVLKVLIGLIVIAAFAYILSLIVLQIEASNCYNVEGPVEIISQTEY